MTKHVTRLPMCCFTKKLFFGLPFGFYDVSLLCHALMIMFIKGRNEVAMRERRRGI